MNAARTVREAMGLNRALLLCGVSKKAWHCTPGPRNVSPDPQVQEMVRKIGPARPAYGTRRMAAQASREPSRPASRKAVRRIFRRLGWSEPPRTKREIIRANKKPPGPKAPNRFWESDMSCTWCGADGWGYCFSVMDVFTRQWLAFVPAGRATRRHAIMAVNDAAAATGRPSLPGLTLRVDNGSQYAGREFRSSVAALGIALKYTCVNTPEQNGHIESFHKTLKKEYVWPREFADIGEAREAIRTAFHDYNRTRIHSAPECLTPSEFAERWGRTRGASGHMTNR